MRFSSYILLSFILCFIICSCQKDKVLSASPPPCLNDSMDYFVGKFSLFEYYYIFGDSIPKKYVDTFQTDISKVSCKTLRILDFSEYEFSFDTSMFSNGKYLGDQYCHCNPTLTFINRDTFKLINYCGGGGSPCPLGRITTFYEGARLK